MKEILVRTPIQVVCLMFVVRAWNVQVADIGLLRWTAGAFAAFAMVKLADLVESWLTNKTDPPATADSSSQ